MLVSTISNKYLLGLISVQHTVEDRYHGRENESKYKHCIRVSTLGIVVYSSVIRSFGQGFIASRKNVCGKMFEISEG